MTRPKQMIPLLTLLIACAPQVGDLIADAGSAVQGPVGQRATLDGADSQAQTWSWCFVELPDHSTLTDADLIDRDTPWPSFVADVAGVYTLELLACDVQRCASDRVQVGADTHGRPLLVGAGARDLGDWISQDSNSTAPEAQASVRRTLGRTTTVLLDGSASSDPNGDPLTWRWSFAQRPMGSAISNADIIGRDQAQASFTPDVGGIYRVRLRVSNGMASDSLTLPVVIHRAASDWDPIPD